MKTIAPFLAAAALWLCAGVAVAADRSGDRTSMPDKCAERDQNCVIQNGPPRNRRGQLVDTTPPADQKGAQKGRDSRDSSR